MTYLNKKIIITGLLIGLVFFAIGYFSKIYFGKAEQISPTPIQSALTFPTPSATPSETLSPIPSIIPTQTPNLEVQKLEVEKQRLEFEKQKLAEENVRTEQNKILMNNCLAQAKATFDEKNAYIDRNWTTCLDYPYMDCISLFRPMRLENNQKYSDAKNDCYNLYK